MQFPGKTGHRFNSSTNNLMKGAISQLYRAHNRHLINNNKNK